MKNRLQFDVQDRRALGIDFSRILVSFGKQVEKENRTKIDPKSIQKGIKKMMEKRVRLGGFGRGQPTDAQWRGENPVTP